MPFFTTLDSTRIVDIISTAKHHVILAAPSIKRRIADALLDAQSRLGKGAVQVVVDPDPNVWRVGYGEPGAVDALMESGLIVRRHAGLRLGVLVCDDQGWAFSTAAQLVEDDPTIDTDAFNAVQLTQGQVIAMRGELPAIEGEGAKSPPLVGEDVLTQAELNKANELLKQAPPQRFDLARQTNVYSAMLQFVELEIEGFNLSARQVRFPPTLPLLSTDNESLKARINSNLKLLGSRVPPKNLSEIKGAIEAMRKQYLIPMGDAGRIIWKKDLPEFNKKLGLVRGELEKCRADLIMQLRTSLDEIIAAVSNEIAANLVKSPPLGLRLLADNPTLDDATTFARAQLESVFPDAKDLVEGMRIRVYFKDVTYATLTNESFRQRLIPCLPESMRKDPILNEDVAVLQSRMP